MSHPLVRIDPNVRVNGNLTFASLRDVDRTLDEYNEPFAIGLRVDVYEEESGLTGPGVVHHIDWDKELVYVEVDWTALR